MTANKFAFTEVPELAEEATWGRRRRQTRVLKGYRVSYEGIELGTVQERLTTFETKTAGRRYVNSRWEAPRWFYYSEYRSRAGRYYSFYDSRQQAAESLLSHHRLVQAQKEPLDDEGLTLTA